MQSPVFSTASPHEMMEAEPPRRPENGPTEKDNWNERSYDIPEQRRHYDRSQVQYISADHSDLDQTVDGKYRQPRPNKPSHHTGTASNTLDSKSDKRSTFTGIVKTAAQFLSIGDSGQSSQKDQMRYTQRSAPRRAPRSAPAPSEQVKREPLELQEIRRRAQSLENTVHGLTKELKKAHEEVAVLKKAVTENEAIINRAHATAISTLAANVSRGITDDMIREELNKFLQTEFFSWCADLCTEKILDEQAALHKLLQDGIINNRESYLKSPEYLKFSLNTPDGSGPLALLQAVLIHRLCYLYLCDAYFLAEELLPTSNNRSSLYQLEQTFGQTQPNAAIDWRIQTVECLEKSVPIVNESLQRDVQIFVKEYGFLLSEKFDEEGNQDLVQIFANFAKLALKLWKTRTNIKWYDLNSFTEPHFQPGNPWIEVEHSLMSRMGRQLNGRPIGLFIHPVITSQSPSKSDKMEEVVWLKALAWISDKDEPTNLEEVGQADSHRV
ncbi:hypothetical protein TsFJ059_003034 [Trichoderma semiorbis]|uniref:Uncharacterized protein n=1 Tax=Trichoderma semiorbis TaxID=1491008 RepID=A0A9P8HSX9_9HYPO|nr:hypothetical protein TsFJ059_003034 [Trichoderma semiorbis]